MTLIDDDWSPFDLASMRAHLARLRERQADLPAAEESIGLMLDLIALATAQDDALRPAR